MVAPTFFLSPSFSSLGILGAVVVRAVICSTDLCLLQSLTFCALLVCNFQCLFYVP